MSKITHENNLNSSILTWCSFPPLCAIISFLLQFPFLSLGQLIREPIYLATTPGPQDSCCLRNTSFLLLLNREHNSLCSTLKITATCTGMSMKIQNLKVNCKKQGCEISIKRLIRAIQTLNTHWTPFKALWSKILYPIQELSKTLWVLYKSVWFSSNCRTHKFAIDNFLLHW